MRGIEKITRIIELIIKQIASHNLSKLDKEVYHDDKTIYIEFIEPKTGLIKKTIKIDNMDDYKPSITFLVGIPASGKSTFKETIDFENNPDKICFNRDSIREMFCPNHNDYYFNGGRDIGAHEGMITSFYDKLVLKRKFNIISDNTNVSYNFLKDEILQALAQGYKVDVIFMMDSFDLDLCVNRDDKRSRTVGRDVIKRMQDKFLYTYKTIHEEFGDDIYFSYFYGRKNNFGEKL